MNCFSLYLSLIPKYVAETKDMNPITLIGQSYQCFSYLMMTVGITFLSASNFALYLVQLPSLIMSLMSPLALYKYSASRGLARHLDGARLFNAAVAQAAGPGRQATGSAAPELAAILAEARAIAQCFDSVSVCFSKGLGAPVGSALCGNARFIARAHRWRKMAGGGMRQAGLLAAAASHALEHHIERLWDDHQLAQRLAAGGRTAAGAWRAARFRCCWR